MEVVGADGCRGGWVGVRLREGRFVEAFVVEKVVELVAKAGPAAAVIGIDIPIGLTEREPREADVAARGLLSVAGLGSSVFPVPPRRVLEADSYTDACAISLELQGKKITKQLWNQRERILDALRKAGLPE